MKEIHLQRFDALCKYARSSYARLWKVRNLHCKYSCFETFIYKI